ARHPTTRCFVALGAPSGFRIGGLRSSDRQVTSAGARSPGPSMIATPSPACARNVPLPCAALVTYSSCARLGSGQRLPAIAPVLAAALSQKLKRKSVNPPRRGNYGNAHILPVAERSSTHRFELRHCTSTCLARLHRSPRAGAGPSDRGSHGHRVAHHPPRLRIE